MTLNYSVYYILYVCTMQCRSQAIHTLIPLPLATLKAVQIDSTEMLNVVCEFPNGSFEAESLQLALDMAVMKDSALNVATLAKGAHQVPNIDGALSRARKIHAFGAYTVLLMLQAAYADDSQLVLALFGKETAAAPITSDPDFSSIEAVLHNEEFPINVILEVAQKLGSMAFCTAVESTSGMRSHSSGCHDGNAKIQDHPSKNETDSNGLPEKKESRGAVVAFRSQGEPPALHLPMYLLCFRRHMVSTCCI